MIRGYLIVCLLMLTALTEQGQAESPVGVPEFSADPGVYRTYRCTFRDENTTTLFPGRLGQSGGGAATFMTTLTFDGDLRVKDYGTVGEDRMIGFSIDTIRSNHFALNGHDVFTDPSMFGQPTGNREVFVSVDHRNAITGFFFPRGTSQVFKMFLTTLIQEIQVSVEQGKERWTRDEVNQHGRGQVHYEAGEPRGDTIQLVKTRKHYDYPGLIAPGDRQDIQTDDRITWNVRGFLEDIDKREETTVTSKDGQETIIQVRKTLRLARTGQGTFDPASLNEGLLASMETMVPGQAVPDEELNRELLAKQAARVNYDEIESWIVHFSPDEKNKRANNAMFYRSTGFVALHPRSAEKLADYCIKRAGRSQERTLVMNLLAAVGSPEAQKAMRTILADSVIQKDPHYGVMIQNFSLVDQKPEPETLAFLERGIRGSSKYVAVASAHAFGASIHKLYTDKDKEKALALNQLLVDKVGTATTADEKSEYIAALGNAGMMENIPLLFACLDDEASTVRTEAVMALRKTESPQVRDRVLSVFADTERGVQRSAIQTFVHYSPEEEDIRAILSQLNQGLIEEANFYDMATLLKKNLGRHPNLVRDCLKRMVSKKLKDPDLEARIRKML